MEKDKGKSVSRRAFLKGTTAGIAAMALPPVEPANASFWEAFLQEHFVELNKDELNKVIARLKEEYQKKYDVSFNIKTTPAIPGKLFGYGLDLSRCIGCRRCVYACVKENNQSIEPQIQWISVLRFERGLHGVSELEEATMYYNPNKVPEKDFFYMPVQCQQCEHPPCVKACPTQATWQEPDGIVVVDYNWCIGCRYCMAACPYNARRFNWGEPFRKKEDFNTNCHYLGNRPRFKGVVEKCTFCIQRTREQPGRYPACVEICPVGARKFGDLNDPNSEINYCIKHQRVFRLKEDINTSPKFFYFFSI